MSGRFLLAIDQGTSSSRAVVFDHSAQVVCAAQEEFQQHYPQPGWVEHDPEAIWASVQQVTRQALAEAGAGATDVTAIGQRLSRDLLHRCPDRLGIVFHPARLRILLLKFFLRR
ncbi:MAG: FGGY family carbohydrate kinase, partial [Woeseiaceae bacterium]